MQSQQVDEELFLGRKLCFSKQIWSLIKLKQEKEKRATKITNNWNENDVNDNHHEDDDVDGEQRNNNAQTKQYV